MNTKEATIFCGISKVAIKKAIDAGRLKLDHIRRSSNDSRILNYFFRIETLEQFNTTRKYRNYKKRGAYSMKELKRIPEIQNLIVHQSEAENLQLEENILNEGIRDPILTWNGIIIDGHHRYEIAQKHNLEFNTEEMSFENIDEAKEWVINNQLGRRNINTYERCRLVLIKKDRIAAESKERMLAGKADPTQKSAQGETRDILAHIAGVSHDTLHKVEKLETEAPQELKEQLRAGTISINAAYKKLAKPKKNATAVPTNLQPSKETPTVPHESITTSNNLETEETLQESTQPEELIDNQSVHVSTNIIDDTDDSPEEALQKTINITIHLSYESNDESDEYHELIDKFYESDTPYEIARTIISRMETEERIIISLIKFFNYIGISASLEKYDKMFLNVENGDYKHSFSIDIKDVVID